MVTYDGKNSDEVAALVERANLPMSYITQGLGDKTLFIETIQGTHTVRKGDSVSARGRKVFVFKV